MCLQNMLYYRSFDAEFCCASFWFDLREFVYDELPSSWPPARVEGGSGLQSMTPDNRDPRDPGDPGGSAGSADCSRRLVIEQHSHTFGILAGPRLPK